MQLQKIKQRIPEFLNLFGQGRTFIKKELEMKKEKLNNPWSKKICVFMDYVKVKQMKFSFLTLEFIDHVSRNLGW